ncbi:MAG: hypothetical protein ACXADU_10395 [Promethearchaeota archaeon]|jgi:hypothetical protein
MSEEARNSKSRYKIIIYHGHLHKIPIEETGAKSKEENLASTEEGMD